MLLFLCYVFLHFFFLSSQGACNHLFWTRVSESFSASARWQRAPLASDSAHGCGYHSGYRESGFCRLGGKFRRIDSKKQMLPRGLSLAACCNTQYKLTVPYFIVNNDGGMELSVQNNTEVSPNLILWAHDCTFLVQQWRLVQTKQCYVILRLFNRECMWIYYKKLICVYIPHTLTQPVM